MVDYNIKEGILTVSAFNTSVTTDTLTLQFKALEDGEKIPFEISNIEFSNDEVMANTTVEVTIAEKTEPVTPVDPEPEEPGTDDEKTSTDEQKPAESDGEKYVDEDGKEITKLPQAGSLAPSIVLGIAVLEMATVVGYKTIKNK